MVNVVVVVIILFELSNSFGWPKPLILIDIFKSRLNLN